MAKIELLRVKKNFGASYMHFSAIKWCFVTPYDIYRVEKKISSILEDVFLSKLATYDVIRVKIEVLRVKKNLGLGGKCYVMNESVSSDRKKYTQVRHQYIIDVTCKKYI